MDSTGTTNLSAVRLDLEKIAADLMVDLKFQPARR